MYTVVRCYAPTHVRTHTSHTYTRMHVRSTRTIKPAQERSHRRKAEVRYPEHADYEALLKRRLRAAAAGVDSLKHLPRGHRVAVHIKYTHFKRVSEARPLLCTLLGATLCTVRQPLLCT